MTLLLSITSQKSFPLTSSKKALYMTPKHNQRNLDSIIKTTSLTLDDSWYLFGIDSDDSDNSSNTQIWVVFISSNETILSDGNCSLFTNFTCSSPTCTQDNSLISSEHFPFFSSSNSTRLNFLNQTISLADDAWRLTSSPRYLHNCDHLYPNDWFGQASGQIGLGLSGNAISNYQMSEPIFSIVVKSGFPFELLFGFNASYTNDTTAGVSLPSDLDWKMQVLSISTDNFNMSSTPITMIFDIQTEGIELSMAYYSGFRDYFFNITNLICSNESSLNSFVCLQLNSSAAFPKLTFTLENGTQFTIPPECYLTKDEVGYSAVFVQYNPTYSGTDYIILGRSVMSQFYTVFQQVNGQNPTITLYPMASEISASNTTESQTNSSQPDTSSNTSSPTNSSTNSSETTNTSNSSSNSSVIVIDNPQPLTDPVTHSPADGADASNGSSNISQGSNDTALYIIIGLIVAAVTCLIVWFIGKRKGWWKKERYLNRGESTLELNDSSFFTSSHSSFHNEDNLAI